MIYSKYLTLLLLFGKTDAVRDKEPPHDGKFFYADFQQIEDGYGLHKVVLSNEKKGS